MLVRINNALELKILCLLCFNMGFNFTAIYGVEGNNLALKWVNDFNYPDNIHLDEKGNITWYGNTFKIVKDLKESIPDIIKFLIENKK